MTFGAVSRFSYPWPELVPCIFSICAELRQADIICRLHRTLVIQTQKWRLSPYLIHGIKALNVFSKNTATSLVEKLFEYTDRKNCIMEKSM